MHYTSMVRDPSTDNLSSIDSQGEDSTFLVKSLFMNISFTLDYIFSMQIFGSFTFTCLLIILISEYKLSYHITK